MEGSLISLLKIEFTKGFGLNKLLLEKDSKKKSRNIAVFISLIIAVIILAGYCYGISYGFGAIGISYVIPGYALTISSLVVLFFTFFKTNGVLFASKDYEMLMAFPFKTETVITAKFLSMYINNLIFTAVVMIPMSIGYVYWNDFNIVSTVAWVLAIIFAPLLPMTIAAIIGTCIAAIGSGFKHKAFVQLFLVVILIVAISGASMWMKGNDENLIIGMLTDIGLLISNTLHKIYPLSSWFDEAVNNRSISSLLLLLGISLIIYAVFVFVCARFYRKINSALMSHHGESNYKVENLKSSSIITAIAKKESKKFFSSSIYMMNVGMGIVMALILSIISIFTGFDKIIESLNIPYVDNIKPVIAGIVPFVIAMIVNMTNTCSVSLSLEGGNLWIVKSLPIDRKVLFKGKIFFNIIMVLPVSIICSLILMIELRVNVFLGLLYVVFSVVSVLFSSTWGMWVNIHFPNFTWQNDVEVIKQGLSSMIAIFSSILGYLAMAAATFFIGTKTSVEYGVLGFSVILTLFGIFLYKSILSCKHNI